MKAVIVRRCGLATDRERRTTLKIPLLYLRPFRLNMAKYLPVCLAMATANLSVANLLLLGELQRLSRRSSPWTAELMGSLLPHPFCLPFQCLISSSITPFQHLSDVSVDDILCLITLPPTADKHLFCVLEQRCQSVTEARNYTSKNPQFLAAGM